MSEYHVFQCDRCGNPVKGDCAQKIPQYWRQLNIDSFDYSPKQVLLCGACFSLIDSLIRSTKMELIDTVNYVRTLKPATESTEGASSQRGQH